MDTSLRALNRFGFGARPGERAGVRDPRGWLREQLAGGPPLLAAPAGASPADIQAAIRAFRPGPAGTQADERDRREARQRLLAITNAEMTATLGARVSGARPFVERLVAFWSNHLCVSAGAKVLVAPLAGRYEREAIRPHVLGRFSDMVLASAKHPAMLIYLDNFQSIGPGSRGAGFGGRGGQRRGLNENYARELLELHTLGVNGGYTQQDVQELAKILTGWTVNGLARPAARPQAGRRGRGFSAPEPNDAIAFAFQAPLHEPGTKTLLGARYAEAGVAEGERAILALCRHASTARFVATKLVTHFVADTPPPAAVDHVAKVFRDTDGDLRAVAAALVDLPDAWADTARKFRTPQDWLVAALRALGAREAPDAVAAVLRQLRHPLWSPSAPRGFSDTFQDWADPESLLNRAELARSIGRRLRVATTDPRPLLDCVDLPAGDDLRRFVADTSIPADERLALALAGPAFQWR